MINMIIVTWNDGSVAHIEPDQIEMVSDSIDQMNPDSKSNTVIHMKRGRTLIVQESQSAVVMARMQAMEDEGYKATVYPAEDYEEE